MAFNKINKFLVFITVLFCVVSCGAQKTIVGKYYHDNPFSSDTLELFKDGIFNLFINKEMLQQRIKGDYSMKNGELILHPTSPAINGYHIKSDAPLEVFDLLTKEMICADYTVLKNDKVIEKGNTCKGVKKEQGDIVIYSAIGYLPYKLVEVDTNVDIFLAPDYYFLKDKYWENWKIKRGKIITPHEQFNKD